MLKKAFTMIEFILVLLIIGILSTILIRNIKTQDFKEKEITANVLKAMRAVEHGLVNIIEQDTKNCPLGRFIVKKTGGSDTYQLWNDAGTDTANNTNVATLMSKYIKFDGGVLDFCTYSGYCDTNDVKGGKLIGSNTYIGFKIEHNLANCPEYRMPLETSNSAAPHSFNKQTGNFETAKCWGYLYIDVNGLEKPNNYGKDVYIFGLGESGIAK